MGVTRLPVLGETLQAANFAIRTGGKVRPSQGANQAASAGRLGGGAVFLGQLGEDQIAEIVKKALRDAGVDVSLVASLPGRQSALGMIFLFPSGENSIISVVGTNMTWSGLPASMQSAIQTCRALLLQREIPEEINIAAARVARTAGKLVVLDVGGGEGGISKELLDLVDIVSPNEVTRRQTELLGLSGLTDIEASSDWLMAQGAHCLLLKLGSQGSRYISAAFTISHPAFSRPDIPVIDTTGAGDCFTAAFVVRLLELGCGEEAVRASLQFASAAAYIGITKKGAMESIPSREDVESFLSQV